jgi:hypothetical protein
MSKFDVFILNEPSIVTSGGTIYCPASAGLYNLYRIRRPGGTTRAQRENDVSYFKFIRKYDIFAQWQKKV